MSGLRKWIMKTDRLEQAIHHAVAETAAPDDSHLAAILARLEQTPAYRPTPRRSLWPWLLLAAAGAAAAGGGYWYVHKSVAPQQPDRTIADTKTPAPVPISPSSSQPGEPETAKGEVDQQRNTAIIYRR